MKRNQSGFTLIEIAIVLVIIGLLLGGVLKGQELINSARVKNMATDFKNIPVFIYGYQDKYRALPGDQAQAALDLQFPPALTALECTPAAAGLCTPANGVIDGDWNAIARTSETFMFWQHVRLAGLAPGPTDIAVANYLPTNAAGGTIGIQSGTSVIAKSPMLGSAGANPIRGSYVICSTGILGKFVKQLDLQMDDGNTATGSMMATDTIVTPYAIGAVATPTANVNDSNTYTVCMGI
jgi:prepilin-type N-terminal cleavage/methylation domain-containing protein